MGILVLISITISLALTDIAIKSTIEGYMTCKEERTVCKGNVILRKVYNRGFSFQLLEKKDEIVKYGTAGVTMLLTIWQLVTLMRKKQRCRKVGLSLMTAGAWSNTFDRWFRGYVIDYAGIQTKWKKVTDITFNLADLLIAVGGVLVMISSLFQKKKQL